MIGKQLALNAMGGTIEVRRRQSHNFNPKFVKRLSTYTQEIIYGQWSQRLSIGHGGLKQELESKW